MGSKKIFNQQYKSVHTPPIFGLAQGLFLHCLFFTPESKAQFTLDFQKDDVNSYFSTCASRFSGRNNCFLDENNEVAPFNSANEQSRFLSNNTLLNPEIVTDPNTGLEYWHMVIGEIKPGEDGFVMEIYIEKGGGSNNFRPFSCGGFGGGHSASGGTLCTSVNTVSTFEGNGGDPLGTGLDGRNIDSGNASGNPNKVIMRQLIVEGEVTMEFLKGQFSQKPRISQTINNSSIRMDFTLDMSNSNYNEQNIAAEIVNTLDLKTDDSLGDFDMATDAQQSNVTAGRYVYTGGTGLGQYDGNYDYSEESIAPSNINWENFFDPNLPENIWSFDDNKPN